MHSTGLDRVSLVGPGRAGLGLDFASNSTIGSYRRTAEGPQLTDDP
ncbi:hypothetical protein JOD64_004882 [Micromonospora luteifusca]|uniref:Uncharacterized protein n=1 Tax=Micromonospora luteifusca TaxID=709860 RepID=A0ABS2LZK7_9ACTN|nr:hypothetical protein [Micromonospora luteifusca]MBM7493660.1 hypothetical protein [Micromonospora luteifusca]